MTETLKLDEIARQSTYALGVEAAMTRHCGKIFERFLVPGDILEIGPAEGLMTPTLLKHARTLTLVEGSELFCQHLRARYPTASVIHSLFETVALPAVYDTIVLGHVLEHVEDPIFVLRRICAFLKTTGKLLLAVPNAHSIHRRAAVLMGLLKTEYEMSPADVQHGHRRVYDPAALRADIEAGGFAIEHFGGYWLKPISNSQIARDWTPAMLDAFMRLGEQHPEIAAEIYVVARRFDGR